jgi:CRISPR-associated protein Cas5d
MRQGIIQFKRPEECSLVRPIREYQTKKFTLHENMQPVESLYDDLFGGE